MLHLKNDKADEQGAIVRLARNLLRRTREFLNSTEQFGFRAEADWRGFWLGIRSARAEQLFDEIQVRVCPNFVPHTPILIDDVLWKRFGF
jgi:hypothetical protein